MTQFKHAVFDLIATLDHHSLSPWRHKFFSHKPVEHDPNARAEGTKPYCSGAGLYGTQVSHRI